MPQYDERDYEVKHAADRESGPSQVFEGVAVRGPVDCSVY